MKELNTLFSMTNSELSRSDAKFRNVGTINSILISAMIAIMTFALTHEEKIFKWVSLSTASFFLILQICSIVICLYGVWPRERYKHSPYDVRFISDKKNLYSLKENNFSEKRLKQIISINASLIILKRELFKKALIITLFPISPFIVLLIRKQDKTSRDRFLENDNKYQNHIPDE